MKLLLTAFEPFGGDTTNPAQDAVKLVPSTIKGVDIVKIDVPVVFDKAGETVYQAMVKEKPDVVLCIGQAGGRIGLTPERVAINLQDARIPDNDGKQPFDKKCFADGENAYFTRIPVKAMVEYMKKANIPASVSYTAGTFVCNDLMYSVLYHIAKEFPDMKGGFMHVPFTHNQVINRPNTPSMSVEDIAKGIEVSIEAIIDHPDDFKIASGTTC